MLAGVTLALGSFNPLLWLGAAVYGVWRMIAAVPKVSTLDEEQELSPASDEFVYRKPELDRATAALLAGGAILICGEEGSGKSILGDAIVKKLREDGFLVASIEPSTPKQMCLQIAEDLGIATENLEGKALTTDKLKVAIAQFLVQNTAIVVVDDAHHCDGKFRVWLKQLRRKSTVPMLLLATDPPRSDVFINIPRIELKPLPEKAIREIMKQAAHQRQINLSAADLAKLQERAGGNPMLAIRAIEEEFFGLDIEAGDHRRYFDITPLILIGAMVFVIMRFIGLGTNDQALYIFAGIGGTVMLGISRILYTLPRESRRI
ncbi:hypothetical protein Cylst_5187 [Cylindrospermum stagnale PCC 7417]|uniref:AAA+ ATPase domain-containing protein n=1 Tax=Cylindrospermum stagnale PCC 7417 TaxID=56107 RepID=K9X586_9NOST|nr:AAA family ATPase [Cylindrospermum stagnale]AFZ27226.1 hypothetical protein Cylst_5187 [Cylindrospermum stagnale PCC 7417]